MTTGNLLRAGALGCALLITTCLTAPAFSQTGQTVPPAHRGVDENGVDLINGTFPFTLVEGTIGSGQAALSLSRAGVSAYGTSNWQNIFATQTISGSTTTVDIAFGDRSERFSKTGAGAFVAAQANGATLTGGNHADFVYTDPNGVEITFGAPIADQGGASPFCSHLGADLNGCKSLATSAELPNGATTSFSWDIHAVCSTVFNPDGSLDCNYGWRLGGVSNSFGYAIDFDYVTDIVPFQQMPSGDWFKRDGATLSNGGTSSSVSYNYVSSSVTEITDAGGRVWRLTSGANSLGIRRPGSSSDNIGVTFSGGIVTSVTRDGVTTNYSRVVVGSTATTTITNALSHQTTVVADLAKGRITSITDPLSRTTSFQYDANGRVTRVTQPEGNYVQYTYDSRGNVTETRAVAKSGSGLADIVTSASFPAICINPVTCNQPTSTTDARSNTTDYTNDSTHGGLLTITPPAPTTGADRPQTRFAYTLTNGEYQLTEISACSAGTAPSCAGTADEARTVVGYDANGNVTSVERRNGAGTLSSTSAMTYDGFGNLLTVDGPLAGAADTTRYRYNASRQVIGVIGPDPDGGDPLKHRALRTTYRTDGLPTKVERGNVDSQSDADWNAFSALEEVQADYDSNDRPTVQRLVSDGITYALTQTSYDGLGRVECVAQRMNPAEFGSLPANACTLDTEGSYGPDRIVRTTYDNAGQVTLVETGYAVTGVAANEVATAYTSNGRVQHVTDAEGNRTTYEYDGHDRLVKTRFPSPTSDGVSSSTDYEQLTLDANGNVTNLRQRTGLNIAFTYDALDRLTLKDPFGSVYDINYSYDLLNRLTAAASPSQTRTFAFDALGRNLSETGPQGTVSYEFDAAGRRTRLNYPGSTTLYMLYDRLVTGEVTKIRENGATSGVGVLATYSYDDLGRRTSLVRGNGTTTSYSYDPVSRLSQLVQDLNLTGNDLTLGFTYNPASQIVSNTRSNDAFAFTGHANVNRTDTIDGLNRVTNTGGTSVGYDDKGNITSIGASTYTYSPENMLNSAPGGLALTYDPLMRLYYTSIGGATTRFGYDGATMIAEFDVFNAVQRRFVHGSGVDEPLVWYEGTGTSDRRWFHADERGSIVAVSDGAGNLVGTRNRYDEYGNPQGTLTGRFGFTGQAWIPEAGLWYYRARIYNPSLGRFMQTDPIGYGGGMNLYAYVLNDPTNFGDPSGLDPPKRDKPPLCIGYNYCTGSRIAGGCLSCMISSTPGFASLISGGSRGGGAGGSGGGSGTSASPGLSPSDSIVVTGSIFGFGGSFDLNFGSNIPISSSIVVSGVRFRPRFPRGPLDVIQCILAICRYSTTEVFRAVGPNEIADIRRFNQYRILPGGAEGKYFYPTYEQAVRLATLFSFRFDRPYTITSAFFTFEALGDELYVAGEGRAYFVTSDFLPHGPVTIHETIYPHRLGR